MPNQLPFSRPSASRRPISAPTVVAPRKSRVLGSAAPEAIMLGRLIDKGIGIAEKIGYDLDRNVLVLGPNGTGKGTCIAIPNLLRLGGKRSVVATDPKCELAAVTAPYRRTLGPVVIINPFNLLVDWPGYEDLKSDGLNPLVGLDPESPSFNAQVALIAEAMITVDPKDPHWGTSGRALTAMLVSATVLEAREKGVAPSMARFREMLSEYSEEPNAGNEFEGRGIPELALKLMNSKLPGLRNKAAQFVVWNRETQGIASTVRSQTEPFDDDEIATDMAKGSFDFRTLKERPTTVYIVLPPEMMERHSKWLRLILIAALAAVMRPRRDGEPKVLFLLDEFFALGRLEIIERVWALVRGYGVQIMPIVQDLGQLKKLYAESWETFVGMAGAVVSFAANDMSTAEWLSRRAGETTRKISSKSTSFSQGFSSGSSGGKGHPLQNSGENWGSSTNYNESEIKVPMLTPHKFFGLPPSFLALFLAGLSDMAPVYAPPYFDVEQLWRRARNNPYYVNKEK